jgi:cytochrome c biogenesis protein CcmG/thiol:disulfide interchange protein DsbE
VSARSFALFIGALAIIALLGFGLISKDTDALAVGEPAPDAELPRLDREGSGSIADHRGDWVLINVWASWCDPCREESPALQDFYERHRRESFEIVGVDTQDASPDALEFVDEFGLTYPQLHDGSGDYADELQTSGVPENILVDPEGDVAYVQRGPVTEEILAEQVAPLIEGGS